MTTMYGTTINSGHRPAASIALGAQDADQEKFWGVIAAVLPTALQLASTLLGQRKGMGGPVTVQEVVADKGFFDIVRAVLPIVTQVVQSLDQPASASDATGATRPASAQDADEEKFWGIIASVLPTALQLASTLLGQRKGMGGDVTVQEVVADKGFFDIVRAVLPIVTRVVQSLDQPAGASDAATTPTPIAGPQAGEQEKFWGIIAAVLPTALQLASTLLGQRKGMGGPVTVQEVVADKGFFDIVRAVLPIVTRVVQSLDQPAGDPSKTPIPSAYYR
ncbi:MAG: hypothetical protein IT305_13440 [Chloroflexi bacterium]|nr:hypothetical protein [Chloroflexota bacterium]